MTAQSGESSVTERASRMLRTDLEVEIAAWMDDEAVVKIMFNPDGQLSVNLAV